MKKINLFQNNAAIILPDDIRPMKNNLPDAGNSLVYGTKLKMLDIQNVAQFHFLQSKMAFGVRNRLF